MANTKEIDSLKKIVQIELYVKSLDFDKRAKEEILKKIDFEYDVISHQIIKDLGQQELNKLLK